MMSKDEVIERLGLQPLGFEGGYFREVVRSSHVVSQHVLPDSGYDAERSLHTAIYYLLTPESFSLMHRLRGDEVYHFYLGDPVELLMIREDGSGEVVHLGHDLAGGQRVQLHLPARAWQGSRLLAGGTFALMGTTMAPGFDLRDFELGDRETLVAAHPEHAELLTALTPARVRTARLELAAATIDLVHAELRSRADLGAGLAAEVPSTWPPPLYDEPAVRYTLAQLERGVEQRSWWLWYVILRDGARRIAVGTVGFKGPPDEHGRVELGYSVLPEHQRRGYAPEAIRGLMAWATEDPRVRGFVAETLADDPVSQKVLEKLGFKPDGEGSEPGVARFSRGT